jgi:hypothetical protein
MKPFFYFRFHLPSLAMIVHKSFQDFVLFLYVHMSQADESYDPSELATIKKKMKGLFSEGTDIERKLYTTIREYNSFDKSRLTDLFQATFHHFNGDGTVLKNDFYTDLNEIILADGKIVDAEAKALKALEAIIDLNSQKT